MADTVCSVDNFRKLIRLTPDTYNEGKQNSHVIIKQIRHQIEVTGGAQAPGVS